MKRKFFIIFGIVAINVWVVVGLYGIFRSQSVIVLPFVPNEPFALNYTASISADESSLITANVPIADLPRNAAATFDAAISTEAGIQTLDVYVPVTTFGSILRDVQTGTLDQQNIVFSSSVSPDNQQLLSDSLGLQDVVSADPDNLAPGQLMIIPFDELGAQQQLVSLDGVYYLDSFTAGAWFKNVSVSGDQVETLSSLTFYDAATADSIFKINMSGVTAFTRVMIRELDSNGGDATFFSDAIGEFLSDADFTHLSNEVSFTDPCPFELGVSFCSPLAFIETMKASGTDLVELTGNHNNDKGRSANVETIELYQSLGWATVGGGINAAEAAKPHIEAQDGSTVAFLAYNQADGAGSFALATADGAGANSYRQDQAAADIAAARDSADIVIVNIQYWECYSYPGSYVEFPQCDEPIGGQQELFRELVEMGADIVIGSSAHQPQTFELYQGKPIYYGLGNLYFDQIQQPGTQRGLILTHYMHAEEHVQTKVTPTFFDTDLQTRIMTPAEADTFLPRISPAD